MSPYFSIIIPTLNEETYLPLVLGDLAQQTQKNFEVIIVDGKSHDQTKQVAEKCASHLQLKFVQVDKRNVSFQRNYGAKMAKGKFLVFLDADNRVPKDFIVSIRSACEKGYKLILPTIIPEDLSQKTKMLISFVNTMIKVSQLYGRPLSGGGNFIIDKEIFEALEGFREDLFMSEDHDLVRRAYDKGVKARISKTVKVTNSMRRGKAEGDMSLISKYVLAFLMYTMIPSDKALKTKMFSYEMGGHRYEAKLRKSQETKPKKQIKKGNRMDMAKLKHLLQMGVVVALFKLFK